MRPLLTWLDEKLQQLNNFQVATGLGFLLMASRVPVLGFVLLIYLTSRLMSLWFGFVTSLVVAYLSFAAYLACLSIVLWQTNQRLIPGLVGGIWSFALLVCYRLKKREPTFIPTRKELFHKLDLLALVCSLVVGFIITRPVASNFNITTTAQEIMGGGDNMSHLEIVKSIDLNDGAVYGRYNRYNSTSVDGTYPEGWHVNVAFLKQIFMAIQATPNSTNILIYSYYFATVLWFMIFAYVLCLIALYVLDTIRPINAVLPPLIVLAAIFGWLVTMFAYGHQAHAAATTFLLLQIFVLCVSCKQSKSQKLKENPLVYIALLAAAGSFQAYYFDAPLVVLSLISGYAIYKYVSRTKPTLRELSAAIVLGFPCLVLFIVRYSYAIRLKEGGQSIYAVSGLVAHSNFSVLLILYLLAVAAVVYFRSNRYLVALTTIIGSVFIFAGILSILYTLHHMPYSYYIFKVNLTCIAGLAVLYGALIGLIVQRVFLSIKPTRYAILFLVVIVLASIQGIYSSRSKVVDSFVTVTNYGADSRSTVAVMNYVAQHPDRDNNIIVFGSCNRAEDIRSTRFARAIAANRNGIVQYSPTGLGIQDKKAFFDDVVEYENILRGPLIIMANDRTLGKELRHYVGTDNKNFRFIDLDDDNVDQSADACPERIFGNINI